jgi:spore coat protein CotF
MMIKSVTEMDQEKDEQMECHIIFLLKKRGEMLYTYMCIQDRHINVMWLVIQGSIIVKQ